MVQINSSCGLFGLLNIYSCRFGFGGHPVAMQRGAKTWLTTCEICGSETRHCQKFEMKSVRVKPGPTQKVPWFKTPKSAMPCVELLVDL